MLNLEIGLRHQNQDTLEQHVLEISNPSHARYGQYMSASEINKMIAPTDDSIDLVKTWLREHGISSATLNPTKDSILVALPVEKIEELLQTTYSVFRHADGSEYVRTPEWSLPQYLHEHIDVIQPTTSFFRAKKRATGHTSAERSITLDNVPGNWNNTWEPVSVHRRRLGEPLLSFLKSD